jgi:hypothetical protein
MMHSNRKRRAWGLGGTVSVALLVSLYDAAAIAQVATTPGVPAVPTPPAENTPVVPPRSRARSITLPDDTKAAPLADRIAAEQARAVADGGLSKPPIIALQWLGKDRRVALYSPRDMREQGLMFVRVVLFVETRGAPKSEIIPTSSLSDWLARNHMSSDTVTAGNNLRASELARFYNTALVQKEALTAEERILFDALIEHGVLERRERGLQPTQPERILITAPLVSRVPGCGACTITPEAREAILAHELGHARFFVDQVYRDFALWFWSHGMPEPARQGFSQLLKIRGYDENNRELMANETQAFLIHTPSDQMLSAAMLAMSHDSLNELRIGFINGIRNLGLNPYDPELALPPPAAAGGMVVLPSPTKDAQLSPK